MKLGLLTGVLMVGYSTAMCPMNDNRGSCINDPMGCGWFSGECVSCNMTTKEQKCDASHFCMWDSEASTCMVIESQPTVCSSYVSDEECQMNNDCKWRCKHSDCVIKKDCASVHSKKVCDRRDDCSWGDDSVCVDVTL